MSIKTNGSLAWERQRMEDLLLVKQLVNRCGELRDAMSAHVLDDGDLLHADFYRDGQALLSAIENCEQSLRASEVGR